jgi:dCTP deaminase
VILPDHELLQAIQDRKLIVEPFKRSQIQPASIDLTLGDEFADWAPPVSARVIDLSDPSEEIPAMHRGRYGAGYPLRPGSFALATTQEVIGLDAAFCARVEGRSSLGRLGLCVHATAGFIDPGFQGNITLELYNMSPHVLLLVPGMRVCQLSVSLMLARARQPYGAERGSKYQNQEGTTPTRWRGADKEGGDADH